ncbi:unnamed protein product [Phyllotreta striolata]|uniref:RAP domain-containing protein n=1 Tax=Phyllotreta striolata TaxID=444603 RepID=A0A9N9TLG0_PHYSR|nr:unnamed protein product [Phyllotreta striolata]
MKLFRVVRIIRNKTYFSSFIPAVPVRCPNICNYKISTQLNQYNIGKYSTENDEEPEELETETVDLTEGLKYILFGDTKDAVIRELNDCNSLEDVWKILEKYNNSLTNEQITQAILVLKDLQISLWKSRKWDFTNFVQLRMSRIFIDLLDKIVNRLDNFDTNHLSYVYLYLSRLGLNADEECMLKIGEKLKRDLEEDFNLAVCSKFLRVAFLESSVRPYYMSMNLIPKILKALDNCDSVEDFSNISTCLNKLAGIVTPSILSDYVKVLERFLDKKKLDSSNSHAILMIISFLNLLPWREKHVELISKCMLLMKNSLHKLDIPYLLLFYDVFFKIQEPAELLDNIQRSAAKFWQQYEETGMQDVNTTLKLYSALLFFSSPLHRVQLRNGVDKLMPSKLEMRDLILIRKIFSHVKVSDKQLCTKYWDIWSDILKQNDDNHVVSKSCFNYMQFSIDIDSYRNVDFEKRVLDAIKNIVGRGDVILPQDISIFLAFVVHYSDDRGLFRELLDKLKDNPRQLKTREISLLSQSCASKSECCTEEDFDEIRDLLKESSRCLISEDGGSFERNSFLIKAAVSREKDVDRFVEDSLLGFKELDYMSSKLLENVSYVFLNTGIVIPEVYNKITEYIVRNKSNIIAFNAEKVLFLCFYVAYFPINADKFFQAVTDIIIRDQERLSGLAFLQSALSLSFFNKLPSFLVKQIFNVEFMDRLDNELANCYSKEKYPQRVRNTLMYLNRTVCLEYPEFNVPWFHDKYVKDLHARYVTEYVSPRSMREYLIEITGKELQENVTVPYGYRIDFVVNLDEKNKVVSSECGSVAKRVAILILKQHAFTRFYSHLRGTYQMKIKHLEMMNYNVSVVKFCDWANLLYTSEKLEFLNNLIWPREYKILWTRER